VFLKLKGYVVSCQSTDLSFLLAVVFFNIVYSLLINLYYYYYYYYYMREKEVNSVARLISMV